MATTLSADEARSARADAAGHGRPAPVSTMRAAVLTGPGQMRIEEVPVPEPGRGQARIRVQGCGVCASNLEPWAGPDWMTFPTAPGQLGHEAWGVVDALGPEVSGLEVGDRVAAVSHHAFAEFDVAEASALVRLPPDLPAGPVPGEPLGCALNVFARSDVQPGQTVAIVGLGFIGALLTSLCKHNGARVIAVSRRGYALEVGRRNGADETLESDDPHAVVARVGELTYGRLCERVIEAAGKQATLDLAAQLTGERGRLIIAGYHQDGPRQVDMQMWNWRGFDVVNAHERDQAAYVEGVRRAIEAWRQGIIDPGPLITHQYPLDQLGAALDATRDRPDGFLKAVVTP